MKGSAVHASLIGTACCLVFALGSMGQSEVPVAPPPAPPEMQTEGIAPVPKRTTKLRTWEVGAEVFNYKYREPGLMSMEGPLYGVTARVTWREPQPEAGWMYRVDARYARGKTDYDGSLWDGTPYTISGEDNQAHEIRAMAGYDWPAPDSLTTLYFGLGYRYKTDDSSDPAAYKRESTYTYLPIGIEHLRHTAPGDLRFALEYDLFLSGKQESHLGVPFGKISNTQNSGYGVRGSVAFTWERGSYSFMIEPFVRYWDIDDSEIVYRTVYLFPYLYLIGFLEPANDTLEAGVNLKMTF